MTNIAELDEEGIETGFLKVGVIDHGKPVVKIPVGHVNKAKFNKEKVLAVQDEYDMWMLYRAAPVPVPVEVVEEPVAV
jgi:hypothetical protein